jgi:hypothetical protein
MISWYINLILIFLKKKMLWETSEIILVDVVGMELSSCCLVNLEDMEMIVVVISCFAL